MQELSGQLCTELCPPMVDVFDDGSGQDRDPTPVADSVFDKSPRGKLYS